MKNELSVSTEHESLFQLAAGMSDVKIDGVYESRFRPVPAGYVVGPTVESFGAANCSPPTPVGQLDGYTSTISTHASRINQIVNSIPAGGLEMGAFAQATNTYIRYVNGLPAEYCVGPPNQAAFDRLNAALANANAIVRRGVAIFESNLDRFVGQATPMHNAIYNTSAAIGPASRDFTAVLSAVQRYNTFVGGIGIEIWTLSARIDALWNQFQQSLNTANAALSRAATQIETNVETEAQRFVDRQKSAEDAFRHWDTVDGKQGYDRYVAILREIGQTLIPEFNAFLSRVPGTDRVRAAAARAQQSINQVDSGFNSFPNLVKLPAETAFPHMRYGSEDRKYAGAATNAAVESIARAYLARTGKKLYVGDMQYEHGGKMGVHKSHRNGIDADVDGIEIGDVPNHDAEKALALAKEILSAGAQLVFYASASTVTDANKWASDNGISGRLQVEANHTRHFHLRMPV